MKYIYTIIFFSFLFIGCGYKSSPIYTEDRVQETKK
jgi:hypothetical protein